MTLPWILLFLPFAVATVTQLFMRRSPLVAWISTGSAAVTFLIALTLLGSTSADSFVWAAVGDFEIRIGYQLDQLATGMMVVVTGVGLLVHVFSMVYMEKDRARARYFTCLALFMFSMTGIVLATNFIMTFIFWELVGVSSYLLIGHWYEKPTAADAAKKAFIVNRVGDFGFMIGILMVWGITGTLTFAEMSIPPGISEGVLGAALLCVFCGAMGKSAQVPLHVWLPDAMEGPTPVSALIHAATMVAAGVYMLFRVQLSLGAAAFDNFSGETIAWIGGITALMAALMATQQNDIKRILAYSTLSQLGYMIMAVGLLAGEAAMFHLFTHAWFKALLFLGAGAIIHACHHQQDIWKMGGLRGKMKITSATFGIGTAALIAVPFITSGFYSKEQILVATLDPEHGNIALFVIAAIVAALTAFYMTRAFIVAFFGKPRSKDAEHAKEVPPMMWVPLALLSVMAIASAWLAGPLNAYHPHTDSMLALGVSLVTLVGGVAGGFFLYRNRTSDPLSIPLLRNRFGIDGFYQNAIVRYFQDGLAALIHFFDEFLINGLLVGGFTRSAAGLGDLFRRVHSGNLQGYAFAFGAGVILVIYFTVFR